MRRPSVVRPSAFSVIFPSETIGQIEAKFHVKLPWSGETKVYSGDFGHMTKIPATPICGKTLQKYSLPEPEDRLQ